MLRYHVSAYEHIRKTGGLETLLREGRVPLESLLVAQKLSRAAKQYAAPSPAARAARQLQAAGKNVQPGQRVRFLFVLVRTGVWAWDRPDPLDPWRVDVAAYRRLLLRAAADIFQPFGLTVDHLVRLLDGGAVPVPLIRDPGSKRRFEIRTGLDEEKVPVPRFILQFSRHL